MPAYPAALAVLSYFGWDQATYRLLSVLSKRTQLYSTNHRQVLNNNLPKLLITKLPYLVLGQDTTFRPKKRGGSVAEFTTVDERKIGEIRRLNLGMHELSVD